MIAAENLLRSHVSGTGTNRALAQTGLLLPDPLGETELDPESSLKRVVRTQNGSDQGSIMKKLLNSAPNIRINVN